MKRIPDRGAVLAALIALVATIGVAGSTSASAPQREARRIIGLEVATVDGVPTMSGQLKSKNDVKGCYRRVPVEAWTRENGQPVFVASADTDGAGAFSIPVPNETNEYAAKAPRIKIDGNSGNDSICRKIWDKEHILS